jgi:hypothetical protein
MSFKIDIYSSIISKVMPGFGQMDPGRSQMQQSYSTSGTGRWNFSVNWFSSST